MEMKVIAHIRSDFPTKFGIPHQSGRIQELKADIIFEPEYRNHEAFRGLEEYTHIWLIWEFSQAVRKEWSPTVRPPRLGGNVQNGRFCYKVSFSSKSHRTFQCKAGEPVEFLKSMDRCFMYQERILWTEHLFMI